VKVRSRFVAVLAIAMFLLLGLTAVWSLQTQDDPQPAPATGGLSSVAPSTGSAEKDLAPVLAESTANSTPADTDEITDFAPATPTPPPESTPPEAVLPIESQPKKDSDEFVIDFVQNDVHTVMHYFALRSGLDLIVEGAAYPSLTVIQRVPKQEDPEKQREEFLKVLRRICEANRLDMIEDGTSVIIKKQAGPEPEPTVTAGALDGRWNVNFENASPWAAAGQCAKLIKVGLSLPQQREQDANLKFSIYMREATPTAIMQRIAAEAGMEVIETTENGAPHFEFRRR
jgi:hypothetical protein